MRQLYILSSLIFLINCGGGNSPSQTSEPTNPIVPTDNTPPVITLNGLDTVVIEVGTSYVDAGATGRDNVDGVLQPIADSNVNSDVVGSYTVTFSVTDAAGNPAQTTSRIVNVVDTTAPVITLRGEGAVTIEVGDEYVDAGASALDNVDGILEPNLSSNINVLSVGSYTITYSVSDSSGNEAQPITRTVNVVASSSNIDTPDLSQLTWGKHEYLRSHIENAQASIVGLGEFFVGAAGVMLSDRHVLAKVAVITRGLEVDKNRKVVNLWGEVSSMKEVYWATPGDKESLCIIELETPFQNYHVPVLADNDVNPDDFVFQVSHSAHVTNGNKGWSVSFGKALPDNNEMDGSGATSIPPLTAYAWMDGNYGAGVFNEQGELVALASGAEFGNYTSPWYIPDQPMHNTIINSLETRSYTTTYQLSAIKSILAQINLEPVPGGRGQLPVNQLDESRTVVSDSELDVLEALANSIKNSIVTLSEGGCSGSLITPELVLTNAHCVVHNRNIKVGFKGGEQYQGDAFALNEWIDLAIVKLRSVAPANYPPVTLADTSFDTNDIGYAIGSPGPLWAKHGGWQVSPMKAKGYRRGDYIMSGYILPGSSGSAVFNEQGDLASVLWGSGYEPNYLLIEGPLDRQDPHEFDLSPSTYKPASVTMADFATLQEFTSKFGVQSNNENEYIYDSLLAQNGTIYVVGRHYKESQNHVLITRLDKLGKWDESYIFDTALQNVSAVAIEQDSNGLIYVLLQALTGPQQIMRLNQDGQLDTGFGQAGFVDITLERDHLAVDLVIDKQNRLVVTGNILSQDSGSNIYVTRLNTDGSLDNSFNFRGWTELDVAGFGDYPSKVIVQDNGILVGGYTTLRNQEFAESDFLVARFTETGILDTSYGDNGLVVTQFREYDHEQLLDMALQPDGKLLATGQNRGNSSVTIVRYLPDGSQDPDFGTAGVVMLDDRYEIDVGVALSVKENGNIIVAANQFFRTDDLSEPGKGHYEIGIYLLDASGQKQIDFGQEGRVSLRYGDNDYVQTMRILDNGVIQITGFTHDNGQSRVTSALIGPTGNIQTPLHSR